MSDAKEPQEFPRDFADVICRDALKRPANLRDFVSAALPDLASHLDFDRAKLIDNEFPLDDWRRRESDLMFLIPYRDGDVETETLICILIEHQSQPDSRMPLRVLLYAVLYWEREWKTWEALPVPRPEFQLTPIVPIVLHTSDRTWNTSRQLADLFAGPELAKVFAPQWPICFWDLAAKTPRELLDSTQLWLKALAVPRAGSDDIDQFSAVLTDAFQQIAALREQDEIRWYDLRHFMLSWARKLRPKEERGQILEAIRQSRLPEPVFQEIQTMSLTIAEADFQAGQEQGQEQGREQGRVEGLEQGRVEGLEQGLEQGREEGREQGVIIGHIQLLESLLNLPASPISKFESQSVDELQTIEADLKSKLANRSPS